MYVCRIENVSFFEFVTYHEIEDIRFLKILVYDDKTGSRRKEFFCSIDEANLWTIKNVITFKNGSAMLIFYCFPTNVSVLTISGYERRIAQRTQKNHLITEHR